MPPGEIFVSGAVLIFPVSDSAMETAVGAEPSGSWMEVERDGYGRRPGVPGRSGRKGPL